MSTFLTLKDIQKTTYKEKSILKDVNLEIKENEIVSIIGNQECGKTTLVNIIAGFERQTRGTVTLRGRVVEGPGQDRSVILPQHTFLPWLNSYENIEMVIKKVMPELEVKELEERVNHFITMGELEEVKEMLPCKLSIEMKKRLSIARALAIHPDVLVMDNPFSTLDTRTRYKLQAYLAKIQKMTGCTIILSTGNVEEALYLSNRVIMMQEGAQSIYKILDIDLPYPRDRITLQSDPTYTSTREKIFHFLYANT